MAAPQPLAPTVAETLAAELAALPALDLASLRARWRKLTRRPAPDHLGRALLLRLLAYQIQARALGDLDRDTARYLDEVHRVQQRQRDARQPGQRRTGRGKGVPDVPAVPGPRKGQLKPGTLLVRQHHDRVHRVMVLEAGFAHGYRSRQPAAFDRSCPLCRRTCSRPVVPQSASSSHLRRLSAPGVDIGWPRESGR